MARKNDIALGIGSFFLCSSALTAGIIGGVYIKALQDGQIASDIFPSCGCAAGEGIETDVTQRAVTSAVGIMAIAMIGVILALVFGLYNRQSASSPISLTVEDENAPKHLYVTGMSLPWAVGLTMGVTVLAGSTGLIIGAYLEQVSSSQIELITVASGVLAGLAAVAFITDYILNR